MSRRSSSAQKKPEQNKPAGTKSRKKVVRKAPAKAAKSSAPPDIDSDDPKILRQKLNAANARIHELERKYEEILNRIEWIIDTLRNVR